MRSLAKYAFASLALAGLASPALAADYKIDPPHTPVLFAVDHLGISKMIGLFSDISGWIETEATR